YRLPDALTETSTHLIPRRDAWKVRGSLVACRGGPADGRVWHDAERGAIVGRRYRDRPVRAIRASDQPLSPLPESSAMITRSLIVVWGLVLMTVAGPPVARGQEPTARDEGAPRRSATETSYKDWEGAGLKGAVAAGGREAVQAGIDILHLRGQAPAAPAPADPATTRARRAPVLLPPP